MLPLGRVAAPGQARKQGLVRDTPSTLPAATASPPAQDVAQGDDIAPIPGTKRVARVEENAAADAVQLTPDPVNKLTNITPAAGDHHSEDRCGWPNADAPRRPPRPGRAAHEHARHSEAHHVRCLPPHPAHEE
jgi:hypothetical protein